MTIMRRKLILLAALLLLVGLAWLFWPSPSFDRGRVHPRLLALKEPYRSVVTEYYLDGGSIGLCITDRDGQVLECALPVSAYVQRYERVLLGGRWLKPGTTNTLEEVREPAETKKMLIRIIERYSPYDVNRDCALLYVRGLPRDYVMPVVRGLLRRVYLMQE